MVMRLGQLTETNLAHLMEMQKDMHLVCLSADLMEMKTVEMMEMGWV